MSGTIGSPCPKSTPASRSERPAKYGRLPVTGDELGSNELYCRKRS